MAEDKNIIKVFGHRGAPTEAPENTLAGFRRAVAAGAHAVEIDLRRTSDGRVVVIHDRTVNRTTDGRGRVDSFTEDEILEFDAGGWLSPKFKGERIPTLDEVLEWAASDGANLNMDMKDPEIEEFVVRRVQAFEMTDRVLLSSWKPAQLARAREMDPGVHVAPILFHAGQLKGAALDLKPDYALLWSAPILTKSAVEKCGAKGVPVIAWKVNSMPLLERVKARGAAAVMTDEPAIIAGYLKKKTGN